MAKQVAWSWQHDWSAHIPWQWPALLRGA